MPRQNQSPSDENPFREYLALVVTIVSIAGLVGLGLVMVFLNSAKDSAADRVFSALLPVFATWVGTILAFYFSAVNFEAAARSQREVIKRLTPQQKLESTPVKEKMIAKDKMYFERLPAATPASQVKLVDLLDRLEQAKKGQRIPVLADNDFPKYVIHRSVIDKFLSAKARTSPPTDSKTLTLQDLLDDSNLGKIIQTSFGIVREDGNLADAKTAMDRIPDCQDVYVTKDGTASEPVTGWVTNVIIQDNSQA